MAMPLGYVVRQTASNLWRNRLMTLAAILTAAVSLSLVGGALMLRQGVNRAAGIWRGGVQMVIFMQPSATPAEISGVSSSLGSNPQVSSFHYVDQAQSYAQFKQMFANQPQMVANVAPSDLPPSFRVVLHNAAQDASVGRAVGTMAGVKKIEYDQAGVKALLRVTAVIQTVALGVAAVLLLSAVVLILNTIRVAIFGRRREVAVMKLVGATNWFIRLPFMVEGLVQGVAGAAVAAGVLVVMRSAIASLIARFKVGVLSSVVVPASQAFDTQLLLLGIGAAVGLLGSAFAVRRFLDV